MRYINTNIHVLTKFTTLNFFLKRHHKEIVKINHKLGENIFNTYKL